MPYLETLKKIRESVAVVVPSRWPEPFGRVALEALMMGTPVVATKSGGLGEIVEDRVTGILTDLNPGELASGLKELVARNLEYKRNIRLHRPELKEKFASLPVQTIVKLYHSLLDVALVS